MPAGVTIIGVEILVSEITTAVSYFVDVLGFELIYRGPAQEVPGETAVIDAGAVAVTLLQPADSGPSILADRTPRVTQLVFGTAVGDFAEVVERQHAAGVSTQPHPDGRSFVPPEVAAGILGFDVALMFAKVPE